MKNASTYQKKIKQLLRGMQKAPAEDPPKGIQATEALVESILQADATDRQAHAAMQSIENEYVDLNELRVSPAKDILDTIGRDHPQGREKAQVIYEVLNGVFRRTYDVSIDYMADMPKRDLRRHLNELGLPAYAAACVVLKVFGGHAVPVDDTLVEVLQMGGHVAQESDLADIQGFLTRIIPHKDALSAHQQLRQLVSKSAKALARKRKADAEVRRKAEQKAKAEAEKARKKAEAEAKARAKEARKTRAKKKVKKKTKKKTAKKATKKLAKTKAKAKTAAKKPAKSVKKKLRKVATRKQKKASTRSAKKK